MKTPLVLLLLTIFSALSFAQSEISSTVNFHSAALEIRIVQQIGSWEEAEFTYQAFKNLSDNLISVKTPDHGRGLAGAVVSLEYPDGSRRIWGQRYVDPTEYPPHFSDEIELIDRVEPKKALKSQTINLRDLFGDLLPGQYKLRLKIPGERYKVNGQAGRDLESEWIGFELVPLSEKVRDAMKIAQPRNEKISLVPQKNVVSADAWIVEVPCDLGNNLETPFSVHQEFGRIVHNIEVFDASLKWRDLGPARDCGNGLTELRINPSTTHKLTIMLPGRRGFYRAALPQSPNADAAKVYSPPVQITRPISPIPK